MADHEPNVWAAVKAAPYVAVYLAAACAANWSVDHWGPRAAVYNAFVLVSLDLVTRDRIHDLWEGKWLWPRLAALVASGSLLSYYVFGVGGRIALASAVAFACAGAADSIVYQVRRHTPWLERSNESNVAGAAADSIAFQSIAFGWNFPLIFAQFTAKVAGGLVWSLILRRNRA